MTIKLGAGYRNVDIDLQAMAGMKIEKSASLHGR